MMKYKYTKKGSTILQAILLIGCITLALYAYYQDKNRTETEVVKVIVVPMSPLPVEATPDPLVTGRVVPIETPTEGPPNQNPAEDTTQDATPDSTTEAERFEATNHFTVFDAKLTERLTEDYGDKLGRNLARRIHDTLFTTDASIEMLGNAIADEMGPAATQEDVDRVIQKVQEISDQLEKDSETNKRE